MNKDKIILRIFEQTECQRGQYQCDEPFNEPPVAGERLGDGHVYRD